MKLALFILLAIVAQASAHSYASAVADADNTTAIAVGSLFEHAEEVHWTVNATDVAAGPVTIAIVDGNPPNVQRVVQLWSGEVDATGELSGSGAFTAANFEPTAQMPVDELFGHIGMGHIFLEVSTAQGTLYGAWEQTNADGTPLAAAGDHDHSQGGAAAGAPTPAVTAADSHDHSDHSGHSHRRMLA
ncbi:aminocarboxymuconate-semialdehyde decarboxylase [Chlorella sorokiniana]|uniref:Aminocarboxymuconate-semialdehyde decarboxylase n=1 Tax=Chlorella sorokiniana TaxID=3076 RepID=A0A2P6U0A0_CHLSO|nr:aminocarboxymuconate-semialdehyde decarboxylase [Chlorella sorokiniana]|eukprot:PRW59745.1 aminocarboxymuconate-semialdehyde decarboxylase [Chlorella sorokiniana]